VIGERPYVLLSAAVSVDGYLDDSSDQRLILSDAEDLDRVDAARAACDAILVGANTIRRDNPGLRVRSAGRRAERLRRGQPESLVRVTMTASGDLDPAARFFAADGSERLVYAPGAAAAQVRDGLGAVATVIGGDDPLTLGWILADLAGRGIGRLMVEGGSEVLAQFLALGLADELQLAIAPLLVADPAAPRLLAVPAPAATHTTSSPTTPDTPPAPSRLPMSQPLSDLELIEVAQTGRMAVLRYRLILPKP
jgi:5-amino-6-(5-phosphoribosylamino)uracil reductase